MFTRSRHFIYAYEKPDDRILLGFTHGNSVAQATSTARGSHRAANHHIPAILRLLTVPRFEQIALRAVVQTIPIETPAKKASVRWRQDMWLSNNQLTWAIEHYRQRKGAKFCRCASCEYQAHFFGAIFVFQGSSLPTLPY